MSDISLILLFKIAYLLLFLKIIDSEKVSDKNQIISRKNTIQECNYFLYKWMQTSQLRILIEYHNNFYIIIYKKIIINLQPKLFYFVSFNAYLHTFIILSNLE